MSDKRRIVVNTVANGVAQFASLLSALVFMPFLIRGFGTTDYGLFLLASSIVGYAALLDFGVSASLVKLTAEAAAQNDRERLGRLVATTLAFYTAVGLVIAVIMVVLAFNTGTFFHVTPDQARLLRNLFFAAAAASVLTWPTVTGGAVLAGFQRYTQAALISVATTVAIVGLTLAIVLLHEGPLVLMVGGAIVNFCGGMAQLLLARRALKGVRISLLDAAWSEMRAIFTIAWAVFIAQICTVILYQQTDRLVLGIFVGAAAIALYDAAGKFQGLIAQLTGFATSAVMPLASQMDAEDRRDALRSLFVRGSKYTVALVGPIVVVLMVVARPLLHSWLPAEFTAMAFSAQVLISHQVLTSGTAVGDSIILGLGKLPKRLPYIIVLSLMNLALSLILVQYIGILGVVVGTAVPYFIDYPLHMRLLLKQIDVPFSRWLREMVLPTYPLLVLPLLASLALLATPLAGSILGIAAIGALSCGLYWLSVYLLGFTPIEREELRGAAAGVLARFRPKDV